MTEVGTDATSRWYRSLDRTQWKALIASNLGWTFDGFEVFALILTIGAALHQLLDTSEYRLIPVYAGAVIAITVFGWGAGGLLGGILADYIGRKRSMTLTILAYSALTGLSALSWNWLSFAIFRFLVGLAIGSEWATGASITAELWPDHARGKGGAFLQSGYPIGSILASGVWVMIGPLGPSSWRYMYLVGVLPALVAFWIRRNIPESPRWERSNKHRRAAYELKRQGAVLQGEDAAIVRFTLVDLFADPAVRSRLLLTFVMSLSVTIGYWGVSSFVPSYVGTVATAAGLEAQRWVGLAGLVQNVGALIGFISFGFLADAVGRKPTTIVYYLMSLVLTPIVYLWVQDIHLLLLVFAVYGFFVQGVFSWTAVWLPELFPTRMRATAAGFIFNTPRLISAIAPLFAGTLIVSLGGYGKAATIIGLFYSLGLFAVPFLPETKGEPLPEADTLSLPLEREQIRQTA
ncbi:MAG TPA: MFS transporter [Pseudolabrys sp.]|jgi:MFS family permease|nr:MFS transporter [Pseudolabrys sp.]